MDMGFTLEQVEFYKLEDRPERFFEILPLDWSAEIQPVWYQYQDSSYIYVLGYDDQMIGGGILFSEPSPDIDYYNAAQRFKVVSLLEKGYGYVGYFFILDKFRSRGLGMKWLDELIRMNPSKGLCLTIDDDSLKGFYAKAGFKLNEEIDFQDHKEWLLVREGTS